MNTYITLIIICVVIFILAGLGLLYFIYDEKKIKEVSNELLVKLGKKYTKEEYENTMFDRYKEILLSIQNENYNFLREAVADEKYNNILLEIKNNTDKKQIEMIDNIKKNYAKLISFKINNDLEVTKLWVSYADNEYTLANREVEDEEGNIHIEKVIIKGDKNKSIEHEYILTFVKGRSNNEDITCPNCGYHVDLLKDGKCIRCDSTIAPKKMHWVYVDRTVTNMEKNKGIFK